MGRSQALKDWGVQIYLRKVKWTWPTTGGILTLLDNQGLAKGTELSWGPGELTLDTLLPAVSHTLECSLSGLRRCEGSPS